MNAATRRLLRKNYEDACNAYADAFCEKHGYYKLRESHDTFWVADEPGGILTVGDEFADMQTILTDINEDAPELAFTQWNDYVTEVSDLFGPLEAKPINFHSWIHGAPRVNNDTLAHLRAMRDRLKKQMDEARKGCFLKKMKELKG